MKEKPKHIVSLSGGKNSTVMLLKMLTKGRRIDEIVFADTTLEFTEMYDYIQRISEYIGRKITITKPKVSWDEWFYGTFTKGRFKGRLRGFPYVCHPCYWQRIAKLIPLREHHGQGNYIYVGMNYEEKHRTKIKQFLHAPNKYRFPLITWKIYDDDCIGYLERRGLAHPLNKFRRTGCWLCPQQSISSLRILYHEYQPLWKKLEQYEFDSPHGFKPNTTLAKLERRFKREGYQRVRPIRR